MMRFASTPVVLRAAFAVALLGATAMLLPARAADKAAATDDKSYLYFRPAPEATTSVLSPSLRLSTPLLGLRPAETALSPSLTFSPSGKARDASKGMSLQLRSRMQPGRTQQIGVTSVQPSAYDFNVALGFQGFAVDAGVARTAEATRTLSQAVNFGLSYGDADWRTRLSVSDETLRPDPLLSLGLLEPQRALAFELGSSVKLASNWALTGGIRYAIGQSMTAIRLNDPNQPNNRSVFVGTAFSF
jgi:hypothetical protein